MLWSSATKTFNNPNFQKGGLPELENALQVCIQQKIKSKILDDELNVQHELNVLCLFAIHAFATDLSCAIANKVIIEIYDAWKNIFGKTLPKQKNVIKV